MTQQLLAKRDPSIYILKCMAVLLVVWSHCDNVMPLPAMATGGAFGDGLFLFCSGFTLFLGNGGGNFANWYKRRINRIYPSIFAWAVIACLFFGSERDFIDILLYGGGWFVTAIMVYYAILYFFRRYLREHIAWGFAGSLLVVMAVYWQAFDSSEVMMYKSVELFCKCHYFLCMLIGAMCGLHYKSRPTTTRFLPSVALAAGFAIAYYGWLWLCDRRAGMAPWQVVSLLPYWGFLIAVWRISRSRGMLALYGKAAIGRPVYWVSALCLDTYLCMDCVIHLWWKGLFPLNLILLYLCIFSIAYCIEVIGKLFAQTFRTESYDWRSIVKL